MGKKLSFIFEISWENGETERYAFIDYTWSGATKKAQKYAKSLDNGAYTLQHECCGYIIND